MTCVMLTSQLSYFLGASFYEASSRVSLRTNLPQSRESNRERERTTHNLVRSIAPQFHNSTLFTALDRKGSHFAGQNALHFTIMDASPTDFAKGRRDCKASCVPSALNRYQLPSEHIFL
ncbi:hypothetical protein O6H91_04G042300 [Diphasiastrum complanatum]|uniref:Uncharacterized protein n=1 Tax=Diphasiastrum complanatum TaxID=34168 RepID=A0ACC2DWF3_DIPCM|nr:hypothetical protein O6H91_04G042300 [Diphasiastrum complanatum]